jgi:phosphatidate cytidylyltransferase
MLRQRLLTVVVLLPVILVLLIAGGWAFAIGIAVMLAFGGIEFVSLMRLGGYRPYRVILVITILLMVLAQELRLFPQALGPGLAAFLIVSMTAMLAAYGYGDKLPAVNFGLTVGSALYIGWLGIHLIALRQVNYGLYWSLIVIPAIAAADSGAYIVGGWQGRRKLSPVVSPGKTWEGYLGGALIAAVVGAACAFLATLLAPEIRTADGAAIGLLAGLISPVGDLGMSTLKRMVGAKDSSNLLPGHGGVLDRIDSVLVGVTIGYYYVIWFTLAH